MSPAPPGEAAPGGALAPLAPVSAPAGTSVRVMVADDHALVRTMLSMLLADVDGFEVVGTSEDGAAAVTQALALRPDVVVMDLNMPRMDGVEATRRIVAALPGTRVVVLTGGTAPEWQEAALAAGATCVLTKDVDPDQLVGRIDAAARSF